MALTDKISEEVSGPGIIDVYGGCQAYRALVDAIMPKISGRYERQKVLLLAADGDRSDFLTALQEEMEHPPVLAYAGEDTADGELEFSLANGSQAQKLIEECSKDDGPSIVVALFQTWNETYLPAFIEACPNITFYALHMSGYGALGKVKFEKRTKEKSGQSIPNVPCDSMYGKAYEYAKSIDCPMGFAYPSVLAAACGFGIQASGGVRPTLYVVNIGDVGEGKSVAAKRAAQLFFGPDSEDPEQVAQDERMKLGVPASDRGLHNMLLDAKGQPRVLVQDEIRNMMGKGSIEGSTLMSLFCELWNSNRSGVADKNKAMEANVKLSLVGNLKTKNPAEFPEVFDYSSAHGFYDRCLFGIEPSNAWRWRPVAAKKLDFNPTSPSMSSDVYEAVHEWQEKAEGRRRLGELALRVAYVSSAVNRDDHVSQKSLFAALRFLEWQERIRSYFQPAEGADRTSQLVAEAVKEFKRLPGMEGNWRELCRDNNWFRKFGAVLKSTKKMLEDEGVLVYDKKKRTHRLYVSGDGR